MPFPWNSPPSRPGESAPAPRRRSPRPRSVVITASALACLLVAAPLLPERHSPRPEGRPTDRPATLTATAGTVDADMRAEIDRVVAEGTRQPSLARGAAPGQLASSQVRCAQFEGQNYCLGQGWTDEPELEVQHQVGREAAISMRRGTVENTGDLSLLDSMRQRAEMSAPERAKLERRELTEAARSVAKVMLLRHEIEGIPLPADFAERHPEAGLSTAEGAALQHTAAKTARDYPQRSLMIPSRKATEQVRSYWCGPATMQMIEYAWSDTRESQATWARRLGTTRSGSAITSLVSITNRYTGWDNANRAGTYVALDIGNYTWKQWWVLMMRHVEDYRAPVILHPLLHKEWYPYLDDDASGHFQMGRGYDKRGPKSNQLSYFEPWNQQRFDPSEPYIKRVQWHHAYSQYRSNLAHFQHNVGV